MNTTHHEQRDSRAQNHGKRIVHLALAEGRGHLMRAHRLRKLLAADSVDVEIATTRADGVEFLRALGTPAWLLPGTLELPYSTAHTLEREQLTHNITRYLTTDLLRDVRALRQRNADLYINDSFHPALMVGDLSRVVMLHGASMQQAVLAHCDATLYGPIYRSLVRSRLAAAKCVQHAFWPVANTDVLTLPPLLDTPCWSSERVRKQFALHDTHPIAVAYLNPHFRCKSLAKAIEQACAHYAFIGFGEGYVDRPGWRAPDENIHELLRHASVFVSGGGVAAIAEAIRFALPLVALEGDQPEQFINLAHAQHLLPNMTRVSVREPHRLGEAIAAAAGLFRANDACHAATYDSAEMWRAHFHKLLADRL